MARYKPHDKYRLFAELAEILGPRLKPPFGIVLGSPKEVINLVESLPTSDVTCFQMDLFQADRLRVELKHSGFFAEVVTAADLWDLPTNIQTLLYPVPLGGERGLKLDMVEQSYHVLKPGGTFAVLSPYEKEDFFQTPLKKVYGKIHSPMAGKNAVLWCQREGDKARRRHEMAFQVRFNEEKSLKFVSRPGAFSYGRFDDGARALVETTEVKEGDRILDLGCGIGTNGIFAGLQAGPGSFVTFVDSNLRALALAEINAKNLDLPAYESIATATLNELRDKSWDLVLANPPYYAQLTITRLFIEQGKRCLKRGGRFFLVTRMVEQVYEIMEEVFGEVEGVERRGYVIFAATN